jgi:hypothetical protein
MGQRLERQRKDLMILSSRVRIPLWDLGTGPSDETVFKLKYRVAAGVALERTLTAKSLSANQG